MSLFNEDLTKEQLTEMLLGASELEHVAYLSMVPLTPHLIRLSKTFEPTTRDEFVMMAALQFVTGLMMRHKAKEMLKEREAEDAGPTDT